MPSSKRIAGVLGPTIVMMVASEFPLVQPHLYDAQIPPVVYLSGVLMFVAGLAIAQSHNLWRRDWTVLVTLSGWFFLLLGVFRMFATDVLHDSRGHLVRRRTHHDLQGIRSVGGPTRWRALRTPH